jgi:hypothetical protein
VAPKLRGEFVSLIEAGSADIKPARRALSLRKSPGSEGWRSRSRGQSAGTGMGAMENPTPPKFMPFACVP